MYYYFSSNSWEYIEILGGSGIDYADHRPILTIDYMHTETLSRSATKRVVIFIIDGAIIYIHPMMGLMCIETL